MRFLYLATVLAVSMAVFAPVDVSAQARNAKGQFVRRVGDDDGRPVRRSVDDEALNMMHMRRIGGGATRSAADRRAAYQQRMNNYRNREFTHDEVAAARREVAAINKGMKDEFRVEQQERNLVYQNGQKKLREIGDAEHSNSISNYPQAGKDVKNNLRKLELDDIPAAKNRVRVDADRVKQWEKQIESFKPDNAIQKGSGFAAVDQVKIIKIGKQRVGQDKDSQLDGGSYPMKLSMGQVHDTDNLKWLDEVRKTVSPTGYVLIKDSFTGNIVPMTQDKYDILRNQNWQLKQGAGADSRSGSQRFSIWTNNGAHNGRTDYENLPKWVEYSSRQIMQNEVKRFQSRIDDAKARLSDSQKGQSGLEANQKTLAGQAKVLDGEYGTKPELKDPKKKNPLNPLNPLNNDAELDSASDFINDPVGYYNQKRGVVVNVDIEA